MRYEIHMGIPEMREHWEELKQKEKAGAFKKEEKQYFKKLVKTLQHLSNNPRHPGLASHEIEPLSRRYGMKVWESYLENNAPAAGRIFWIYGPGKGVITVIGIEPHPEDRKRGGYKKAKLSDLK
jgi:hypothetical protein